MRIIDPVFCFSVIIAFNVSFFSCQRQPEKIPPDIIPRDKMVKIFTDVQIGEAHIQIRGLPADTIALLYQSILAQYGVSQDEFRKSFTFYTEHPDILEKVYEEVLNELSKRHAEMQSKEPVGSKQ
ncbi:MAG: DUF4296 domain-containing protein [Bacteroidetes bacterium]|nr:DUF4296 domain-containing protein [Bacteroidota bacterium]